MRLPQTYCICMVRVPEKSQVGKSQVGEWTLSRAWQEAMRSKMGIPPAEIWDGESEWILTAR
jgi:hypothetical protein